jgi:hypothetical protein
MRVCGKLVEMGAEKCRWCLFTRCVGEWGETRWGMPAAKRLSQALPNSS